MAMEMTASELAAFREMAASFARRELGPILEHESPDGDLGRLEAALASAAENGLLASTDPDQPGYQTGVWGGGTSEQGPRPSLALLEELAHACAGVAMAVHAHGLACRVVQLAAPKVAISRWPAMALMEGGFPPSAETIEDPGRMAPARIETVAVEKGGGYELSGRKDFIFSLPDPTDYVVFARADSGWAAFLVPASAAGLAASDAGFRMGLRACAVSSARLEGVKLPWEARLKFGRPESEVVMEWLRLWNLGLVAIGAGSARGAIGQARRYAEERYQGGIEIINHPAMGMLLADSEARVMVCQGLIERALQSVGPRAALLDSAKARLAGVAAAAQAVTDSLQVFGGYGYMEDYRMEKRFRDLNALKCAGGSARDLRALIAALSREA